MSRLHPSRRRATRNNRRASAVHPRALDGIPGEFIEIRRERDGMLETLDPIRCSARRGAGEPSNIRKTSRHFA